MAEKVFRISPVSVASWLKSVHTRLDFSDLPAARVRARVSPCHLVEMAGSGCTPHAALGCMVSWFLSSLLFQDPSGIGAGPVTLTHWFLPWTLCPLPDLPPYIQTSLTLILHQSDFVVSVGWFHVPTGNPWFFMLTLGGSWLRKLLYLEAVRSLGLATVCCHVDAHSGLPEEALGCLRGRAGYTSCRL